jgi:hypothetical protein
MGTTREDHYRFGFISRSLFLRMRNISDKSCRQNKNTHFCSVTFFKKIIYTYIYTHFSVHNNNYICFKWIRNYKEAFCWERGFRFAVLTAVGIKITIFWDVTQRSSVESVHVSKISYIFIFDFIISLYGDIGVYRLHKVCCSFCYCYRQGFFLFTNVLAL